MCAGAMMMYRYVLSRHKYTPRSNAFLSQRKAAQADGDATKPEARNVQERRTLTHCIGAVQCCVAFTVTTMRSPQRRHHRCLPRSRLLGAWAEGARPPALSGEVSGTSSTQLTEKEGAASCAVGVTAHFQRKDGAVRDQPAREIPVVVGAVPP